MPPLPASRKTTLIVTAIVAAGALLVWALTSFNAAQDAVPTAQAPSPTADPKKVTFTLGDSTIVIGKEGAAYFGNEVRGDFDGNGSEDEAFLITNDGGGSGTFFYAVAALKTSGGYVGTNAVLLGDRIAPQSTEFRDGTIIVNYAVRNPGEPMTTRPTLGMSTVLRVVDGTLVEVE